MNYNKLYTCITCNILFDHAELQREHYKSDWHRYNLKRKVACLAPITFEGFKTRLEAQNNTYLKANDISFYCNKCQKHFNSKNSFTNHMSSKRHQRSNGLDCTNDKMNNLRSNDDNLDLKGIRTKCDIKQCKEESMSLPYTCLLCQEKYKSIDHNLDHMLNVHSFFIPDIEFLIDKEGLLSYLANKIQNYNQCLWCNHYFASFDAVRKHMLDKGHLKISFEDSLPEYVNFYDYSNCYQNENEINDSKDLFTEANSIEYQLVLPSGNTIGHRSLLRYYKQKLLVQYPNDNKKIHNKIFSINSAVGQCNIHKEEINKKYHDMALMNRIFSKAELTLNLKTNKFQKYLRSQIGF